MTSRHNSIHILISNELELMEIDYYNSHVSNNGFEEIALLKLTMLTIHY